MFLSPKWLLSHLFAASLIVAFIFAGFWQINRLGERQADNALAEARMNDVVLLGEVIGADPSDAEFRRVQVTGRFDPGSEILIANRSNEGAAGFWIWTNFLTDDGDILVSRGFVGRGVILGTSGSPSREQASVTDDPVVIEGLLRTGFDSGRTSSDRSQITRPNPVLAGEVLGLDTALDPRLYLSLTGQEPPRPQPIPVPVPLPDLSEGPHRSYAFQWFTFATIGTIGYLLVLKRISRGDQARGDVPI